MCILIWISNINVFHLLPIPEMQHDRHWQCITEAACTWSKESARLPSPESPTGRSGFPAAAPAPDREAPSPPPGNRPPRRPAARRTVRTGVRSSSERRARTRASPWSRSGTPLRAGRRWPPPRGAPAAPGRPATRRRSEAGSAAAASPGRSKPPSPAARRDPPTGPREVSSGRRCQTPAAPAGSDSAPDPCSPSRPSRGVWTRTHQGPRCVTVAAEVLNKPWNRGHECVCVAATDHAFITLVFTTEGTTLISVRPETNSRGGTT